MTDKTALITISWILVFRLSRMQCWIYARFLISTYVTVDSRHLCKTADTLNWTEYCPNT